MSNISLLAALAAGVLALLSPCSALLLPSFFAYAFSSRRALVARTSTFYLGLLLTLVPLGTGAAAASTLVYGHRGALIMGAGWTIIALGLVQLLGRGFRLPFADQLQTWSAARGAGRGGYLSTFMLGAVYGFAGFCAGPVLGAILTLAATQSSPAYGGLLLAVYALGMAVPLFVLAWLWDRFRLGQRAWVRGRLLRLGPVQVHTTNAVAGLLFVAIGVLFLVFDGTAGLTGSFGLGDTTDLESTAQHTITELAAAVPVWVLPAAISLVAAVVAWSRVRGHRPAEPTATRTSPGPAKVDEPA
jgi:cytochrome c biogenesis protein CcdA